MRVLGLERLVHGVPEDDPTVHWSRCLSFDRRRGLGADNSSIIGFEWVGLSGFQLQSSLLVLGHLNESLGGAAIVHGGEGNGRSNLLSQAVLEVLHESVTEQVLDVGLEQHCLIAMAPSNDARIERALELVHHGFLSVRCVGIDGRWRRKIGVGSHCQVWGVDEETQKQALQTCLCLCQRVRQKKVWCRRKDLLRQKGALFVPLPSLLSLCQPLGCAPLAIFLVLRAFAHSTDNALSHSLASPLCFHRPWVQLQGRAGGRRSGWNRQRKIGGGCVYCWPGDGEGEANGEMMRGVVWEDRGTDGGVLLVEDGPSQVS
jgi:hypothetical protein